MKLEKPCILGVGHTCIDLVHFNGETIIMNGGSCANVLSVLSLMGYECSILREKYSDFLEDYLDLLNFSKKEICIKMFIVTIGGRYL